MDNKDLYSNCIKKKPILDEKQVFLYFLQILNGMEFLHNLKICHRDIKPDNILFNGDKLKIADFSLAENTKNKLKGSCGTPGFLSPEVFYSENYTEKVDIFSLGVVLYMMLKIHFLIKINLKLG